MVTTNLIEAWVSIKRLTKFFGAEELQPDARTVVISSKLKNGDAVCVGVFAVIATLNRGREG
jgi:ATP-binding cassette subfamily C (CFTR/MRP) protein 1